MRNRNKKRYRSSGSDTSNASKAYKVRGPSGGPKDTSVIVSEVLNESNRVLFDADVTGENNLDQVFHTTPVTPDTEKQSDKTMAEIGKSESKNQTSTSKASKSEPTIADVMNVLNDVSHRLSNVETKLSSLDSLEKKVEGFDRELKKIRCALEDRQKKTDDNIRFIEEKAESTDFAVGQASSKISELEKT